jgi:hypothetical protein
VFASRALRRPRRAAPPPPTFYSRRRRRSAVTGAPPSPPTFGWRAANVCSSAKYFCARYAEWHTLPGDIKNFNNKKIESQHD